MPDGHARADDQRGAGVRMADRAVLHIAVLADQNRGVVGADHRPEPHARAPPQPDIPDQIGRRGHPGAIGKQGRNIIEGVKRHGHILDGGGGGVDGLVDNGNRQNLGTRSTGYVLDRASTTTAKSR